MTTPCCNAVFIRCVDKRHTNKAASSVSLVAGEEFDYYEIAYPGGAGVLADIEDIGRDAVISAIGIAIKNLGCVEIFLSVHGISCCGVCGCGMYNLAGYAEHYASPEASRRFSLDQLAKAKETVKTAFPNARKVRTFYITIDKEGNNFTEEVGVGS